MKCHSASDGSLQKMSWHQDILTQYFHCLGLGLALTVLAFCDEIWYAFYKNNYSIITLPDI